MANGKKGKVRVLAEIGPPGCGKGTTLKKVITPYCEKNCIPLVVIPMSQEISIFLEEHPSVAQRVKEDMRSGRLVEDSIVIEVLKRATERVEKNDNGIYVLDGMPRSMGQIEACLHGVCNALSVSIQEYIFLDFITPPYLCGYRAAKRDEGREDDGDEQVFITRWSEFEQKTQPAIDYLKKNHHRLGFEFVEINGQYVKSQPELAESQIFGHS